MAREKKRSIPKASKKKQSEVQENPELELDDDIQDVADSDVQKKTGGKKSKKNSQKDEPSDITESDEDVETDEAETMLLDSDNDEFEEMPIEMEGDITSIYDVDSEGEDVDMTTFDQGPSRWRKWIIGMFVVIVLALLAYIGYLFFGNGFGGNADSGSVEMNLAVDKQVASGDVVTIELSYTNKKESALEEGEIEFIFPDGFQFHTASPEPIDEQKRLWEVDKLQPGMGGKIKITGQMLGEKDEVKKVSALWSYSPANFSQLFQETVEASTTITSSVLETEVEAPEQASDGQEVTYILRFTNTSAIPLERVQATVEYPDGFEFTEATQQPANADNGNNEWQWEVIASGEQQVIEIKGIMRGESGEEQEFVAQVGVLEIDNTFNKQIERTSTVLILNPELSLTINAPSVVTAGEEVTITVVAENTSQLPIKELEVVLALEGELFDESNKAFEKLERLKAGEKKEYTYKTTLGELESASSSLKATASIAGAVVNASPVSFADTAVAEMKVQGEVSFTAEGRYFDEDLTKIGSGPLPPKVNNETTYVIRWNVVNNSNDLNNLEITTTLPEGLIWPDEASTGVEYDSSTRTVTYSEAIVRFGEEVAVEFEVTVSPIAEDLNKLLPLTGDMTFTATDSSTGEVVTQTQSRITTDLPNDEGAKGKGVVEA